ncbi:MAG: YqeG family HAD IIIA-type phosphatase [Vampirovibrionales bacterium]
MWITPDCCATDLTALSIPTLWEEGIRGLLLDLDNTLIPNHPAHPQVGQLPTLIGQWLTQAQFVGMKAACVTNNKHLHYCQQMEQQLGIPLIPEAQKPWGHGLSQGLRQLDLPPKQVAVIGDRPSTDGLGAHWLGCRYVAVTSLSYAYEPWLYHCLRGLEHSLLKAPTHPHWTIT